jgi:hypothetical protein
MKMLPPLMRAGKDLLAMEDNNELVKSLLGTQKKRSKREENIDRKIEHLLDTYKKQDEELVKKAEEKEMKKFKSKKMMRDKFGFSDDEEEDEADQPV